MQIPIVNGMVDSRQRRARARRLLDGAAFMPRGIALFVRRPRLWALGFIPVLFSAVLVIIGAIALAFLIDDVTTWVTPFADAWPGWLRGTARVVIGILVVAGFLFGVALTFAEVTNVIGQPFFEVIADQVEKERGNAPPETGVAWWRTLPRTTVESIVTFTAWIALVIPLFLAGFLPLVGQTVIPVVAAIVSGFFISMEILQIPLERRGLRLRQRLSFHLDARHRPEALGFGIAAFLLFLVPLMNVVAMPGAIVGATLLVRRLTGVEPEPSAPAARSSVP